MNDLHLPRALIVDDDPDARAILHRVCTGAGWRSLTLESPELAIKAIGEFRPDVIFWDLTYPDGDGVAQLTRVAQIIPKANVVLVSGCEPEVLRSAQRVGARMGVRMHEPIEKPVSLATVRALLAQLREGDAVLTPVDLRAALNDGQISMAYQPKVRLSDGAYVGVEALGRWTRSDGVAIPPSVFIPVVEMDRQLARDLLLFGLDRASTEAEAWRRPGTRCAVNLSATCLNDLTLPDYVLKAAVGRDARASDFVLEVTETASLGEPDRSEEVLTRLRIQGYQVSLDDFGTGHSSLLHLQRMPFSELKIDRQFVVAMGEDRRAEQIVHMMVSLGKALGVTTVAEGVETSAQIAHLTELGCDVIQGYFIARPMSADQCAAWIEDYKP
ncbi:EAL domain-containing response regulator [Roseospirillum parvum]|uniref:EAL domain, c-di-GMP-specific phosphodiesterase class I (Or its enzymatically inactive variant) n=1 Tax=Roseospirillum parvum TaxID=83401 RepID=A0A1G8BV69_9PROT|nr:EAL domain-containing response regulator [Roseospirillum parvum]SDH37034.1 EAL domain, c-di-GMP-specific phosphodiesterase class I (or its enzymatically inactive variant) [Roseospirillum parvum]